jgi:hypothetical protein
MTQGVAAIITNGAKMRGSGFGWKCNRNVIIKSILTSLMVVFSRANEEGETEKSVTAEIQKRQLRKRNRLL